MHDNRITRLERSNRRLTIALVALAGLGGGGVLAGFAKQPTASQPEPQPEYVGLAIDSDTSFVYRMHADGTLERLSLRRGRVPGGGTPAVWNHFPTGVNAP